MKLFHTRKTEGTLPKNIKRGKELHKVARLRNTTGLLITSCFCLRHTDMEMAPKTLLHYEDRQDTTDRE